MHLKTIIVNQHKTPLALILVIALITFTEIQCKHGFQGLRRKAKAAKKSLENPWNNYLKREFKLPEEGNCWDYYVRRAQCNGTYEVSSLGVFMFLLEPDKGTSDRIPCNWGFVGSQLSKCTVSIYCPKIINFNVYPEPDPDSCVENFLTLYDGTEGKMTGCGKFKFADKPRIPRNGGIDVYVSFKGKTEEPVTCYVFCAENMPKPNSEGLPKAIKIGSNKDWKGFKYEEDCRCGRRREASELIAGRIVNGMNAERFEFPWFGGLVAKATINLGTETEQAPFTPNNPFCGGSVINDRWFLTAGHCVKLFIDAGIDIQVVLHAHVMDRQLNQGEDPNDPKYQDVPGWNAPNATDESEQRIRLDPDRIIYHPLYNEEVEDWDVALIRFQTRLDFKNDKRVSPICLPYANERFDHPDGTKMTAAGWGYTTHEGKNARILQKIVLDYMNHADCSKLEHAGGPPTLRHMCAGVLAGGKDTCQGDSGSPLIFQFDGKNYMQAGLVSTGDICALKDRMAYYTNIPEVVQWIYKQTAEDATWCPR